MSRYPLASGLALLLIPALFGPRNLPGQDSPPAASGQPAAQPSITMGQLLRLDTTRRKSLQRRDSFLGVESMKNHVQLAFVIDGTDSMQQEIEELKDNLQLFAANLEGYKGEDAGFKLELALVVYRDQRAESGRSQVLLDGFTTDVDRLRGELRAVKSETGAPYFEELADEGLYRALEELQWASDSDDTTRWIVLCGDAPPYREEDTERKHSTIDLIGKARDKRVQIYSVLAGSGFKDRDNQALLDTARRLKPYAQEFMQTLATETGGRYLDLWDEQRVQELLTQQRQVVRLVPDITDEDVIALRKQNGQQVLAPNTVTLAVLPHVPMNSMTFDTRSSRGAELAVAINAKFKNIPGLQVVLGPDVEAAFRDSVAAADTSDSSDIVHRLAKKVGADYVIWGDYKPDFDQIIVTSRLYDRFRAEPLAEAEHQAAAENAEAVNEMALYVFNRVRKKAVAALQEAGAEPDVITVFSGPDQDSELRENLETPFSENMDAQHHILAGLNLLERALAFVKPPDGTENPAIPYLVEAKLELEESLKIEPENPFTHLLLSACFYNLANVGQVSEDTNKQQEHLELAYNYRHNPRLSRDFRTEIEAQYALLVTHDFEQAIELFTKLAQGKDQRRGNFTLRAHWMLAGIYLGDWDVDVAHTDVEKARDHILEILAWWPDSPQAEFYNKARRASDYEDGFPVERQPSLVSTY